MRIALHGPMYTGKTTLAQTLASAHGFTLVNYTDYLKSLAARALTDLGQWTTVEMIKADKNKYRAFLQNLGTLLEFDDGGYVEVCLFEQASLHFPYPGMPGDTVALADNIVFDNVRTQHQFDILKHYGFRLVRLSIPESVQVARAEQAGVSFEALSKLAQHSVEQPMPTQPNEIWVNGALPLSTEIADILLFQEQAA